MTELERTILDMVAMGLTNDEISENRGVSPRTTEVQIRRIARKLGVEHRRLRHHILRQQFETLRELGLH